MPITIVSSKVVADEVQIDARRSVIEKHVDDAGQEYLIFYMAEESDDVQAALMFRAIGIETLVNEALLQAYERGLLEQLRAETLLTLSDPELIKILIVTPENLEAEKAALTDIVNAQFSPGVKYG
jgi:hypothetical protein